MESTFKRLAKGLVLCGIAATVSLGSFACANKVDGKAATVAFTQSSNDIGTAGGGGSTCNFVKSCDAGTHADYALCQCVKDVACPAISCAAPPAGCNWVMVVENGCITGCGKLSCKSDTPPTIPSGGAPEASDEE